MRNERPTSYAPPHAQTSQVGPNLAAKKKTATTASDIIANRQAKSPLGSTAPHARRARGLTWTPRPGLHGRGFSSAREGKLARAAMFMVGPYPIRRGFSRQVS